MRLAVKNVCVEDITGNMRIRTSKRRMPFGLTMKIGCREIIKYGLICA